MDKPTLFALYEKPKLANVYAERKGWVNHEKPYARVAILGIIIDFNLGVWVKYLVGSKEIYDPSVTDLRVVDEQFVLMELGYDD